MLRSGASLLTVAGTAELSPEAVRFVKADRPPREFVQILVRNRLWDDVVGFLAHVLPLREAIWWAWSCVRDASGESAPVTAVLEAARVWILEPTEEHRRTAQAAGEAIDYDGAAGFVGLAVFMSGGSLGPPDAPVVAEPAPDAAAKAIAGAVTMAAAEGDPAHLAERYTTFIGRALERADKGNAWAPDSPAGA